MFYLLWYLQTILESLPISSSGHLRLLSCILDALNCGHYKVQISEYTEHLMHIPTAFILCVFLTYQYSGLFFNFPESIGQIIHLFICIFLADIITVTLYFIFNFMEASSFPIAAGFLITALSLISLYFAPQASQENISYKQALIIGLVQGIALLPGISRLGATYVVGYWLGLSPLTAITFSLTIQFPLILAGITKGLYLIIIKNCYFPAINFAQVILLGISSIISYKCLLWVIKLAENHMIAWFGIYLLLPAILAIFCK